jgi:hypothetical protein
MHGKPVLFAIAPVIFSHTFTHFGILKHMEWQSTPPPSLMSSSLHTRAARRQSDDAQHLGRRGTEGTRTRSP